MVWCSVVSCDNAWCGNSVVVMLMVCKGGVVWRCGGNGINNVLVVWWCWCMVVMMWRMWCGVG